MLGDEVRADEVGGNEGSGDEGRGDEGWGDEGKTALANVLVKALSDALTGLGNRRAMIADLSAAVDPTHPKPTILVLFDLDGFKEVNDAFGHHAGDLLLMEVSLRIRATIRTEDMLARIGGDEFVLLVDVLLIVLAEMLC